MNSHARAAWLVALVLVVVARGTFARAVARDTHTGSVAIAIEHAVPCDPPAYDPRAFDAAFALELGATLVTDASDDPAATALLRVGAVQCRDGAVAIRLVFHHADRLTDTDRTVDVTSIPPSLRARVLALAALDLATRPADPPAPAVPAAAVVLAPVRATPSTLPRPDREPLSAHAPALALDGVVTTFAAPARVPLALGGVRASITFRVGPPWLAAQFGLGADGTHLASDHGTIDLVNVHALASLLARAPLAGTPLTVRLGLELTAGDAHAWGSSASPHITGTTSDTPLVQTTLVAGLDLALGPRAALRTELAAGAVLAGVRLHRDDGEAGAIEGAVGSVRAGIAFTP